MTKRQVFYSFHYQNDVWRTSQIRQIGSIEGNKVLSDNSWEEVKRKGDRAISNWIDDNLKYRSCTIVLVGSQTSQRKWVKYEIEKSWNLGKGVLGIYVHNLKCSHGNQSNKGENPFRTFKEDNGLLLSNIVKCHNPPYKDSKLTYRFIKQNIAMWVEEAIQIRNKY